MTRRELREQIFKLLFGVEFHDRQELPEQIAVYEETEEPWDTKDGAYISGKCEDIVAHLAEIDEAIDAVAEGWKTGRMGKALPSTRRWSLPKSMAPMSRLHLSTVCLQSWYEKKYLFCRSGKYIHPEHVRTGFYVAPDQHQGGSVEL